MKLGVIGTGMIAKEVLPVLAAQGQKITALCGTPRSKAVVEGLCREYAIGEAYVDYDAMLEGADLDTIYIAIPNFLHYNATRKALEKGWNVILEKPMASNIREAEELAALAKKKGLYLFEAITTVHLPNFETIRQLLPQIGKVKIVTCNFSQYSSRYDAFCAGEGETPPVFDRSKSGGALMDLNLYNLHYLIGLFGEPKAVSYHPNIERGVDTSGVLLLDYGDFHAVSIAAKDCFAQCRYSIQGTEGYISQDTPANTCGPVTICRRDGTQERFDGNPKNRLEPEFRLFAEEIASGDRKRCYEMLSHSLSVFRVLTEARVGAGISFPADSSTMNTQ